MPQIEEKEQRKSVVGEISSLLERLQGTRSYLASNLEVIRGYENKVCGEGEILKEEAKPDLVRLVQRCHATVFDIEVYLKELNQLLA